MFQRQLQTQDTEKCTSNKSVKTPASALTKTLRHRNLRTRRDYISKVAISGGL